ncbi:Domain of unknown function DUF4771 [Cinara cedri]|uniref:DUF4771 domain-containing protein n=1 Tax=Cinara cedri TaxID=506608 RepID=A0A5E4M5N7_9HEMI|nr:Domain of unknown function DUF4771 [Cinara cedri]
MKDDMDLGTTKSTRRALKNLGVRMFIPHVLAMKALYDSRLYPVPFLTTIKNYVMHKSGQTCAGTDERMCKSYTPEQRILMSSILHMEFPRLLKKLDYCLSPRIPDKPLVYKTFEKRKPADKSYVSPYMEPIPLPTPWSEIQEIKWHNVNVKLQRARKVKKNVNAQLQHQMQMDVEKKTILRMGITYPKHPLKKLFYNPPIIEKFKEETAQQKNDMSVTTAEKKAARNKKTLTGGDRNAIRPGADDGGQLPSTKMVTLDVNTVHDRGGNPTAPRYSVVQPSPMAVHSSERVSPDGGGRSDEKDKYGEKPYGWLKTDQGGSRMSLGSSAESLPVENANKPQAVIDLDSLIKSSNNVLQHDCNHLTTMNEWNEENDEPVTTEKPKPVSYQKEMRPVMNGPEKTIWQMFEKHRGAKSLSGRRLTLEENARRPRSLQADRYSAETVVTDVTVDGFCQNEFEITSMMVAFPRTPPASTLPPDDEDNSEIEDFGDDGVRGEKKTGEPIDKKSSVYGFPLEENRGNNEPDPEDPMYADNNLNADYNLNDNDLNAGETIEQVLAELRKLPPWKQLKAVLKFLAVLGDPVAGFQELMLLKKLRRWYEKRINVDRHLTPKINDRLIKKSMAVWKCDRPKISNVKVPIMPIDRNDKITWDSVHSTEKLLRETKSQYTTKMKHMAINNAREIYSTTNNEYYTGRLSNHFKQTFYDYFPAKEDDCLFSYPAPS